MSKSHAIDVAAYILRKLGPTSAMKLQKLVYYSQAWATVWDDEAVFDDEIEAWANGPVVRSLYAQHRQQFILDEKTFQGANIERISAKHRETIDIVLDTYGKKSAQWLSDQTHAESPWIEARNGLSETQRGDTTISLASISEYYSSLN